MKLCYRLFLGAVLFLIFFFAAAQSSAPVSALTCGEDPTNPCCAGDPGCSTGGAYCGYNACSTENGPKGYFDTANCSILEGWACDDDNYDAAIDVDFKEGAASVGKATSPNTSFNRGQGVANACGGNPNHGFRIPTPDSLKTGTDHTISAIGINVPGTSGGDNKLQSSPKIINCPIPPPTASVSGPTTGNINSTLRFTGRASTINTNLSKGELWVARTDKSSAASWCAAANIGGTNNAWCKIGLSTLSGKGPAEFTTDWITSFNGNYYVAVNAYDNSSPVQLKCGGNPWCNFNGPNSCAAGSNCEDCSGWNNCGINSYQQVSIGCPAVNPPTNLSPSGTTQISSGMTGGPRQVTWLPPSSGSAASSYQLRIDDLSNGWKGSCNTTQYPGDVCANVDGTSYPYLFASGTNYRWWIHSVNSCGAQSVEASADVTPLKNPVIDSLEVKNANENQVIPSTFSGTNKISGLTAAESGANWLNPLSITLNAYDPYNERNSPKITEYYVAFYDKTSGLASATSHANFLSDIQTRLNSTPSSGFLLRYNQSTNTHFAWDGKNQRWTAPLSSTSFTRLLNKADQLIYGVYSYNKQNRWRVDMLSAFGSKNMYTGASVVSIIDNITLTDTEPEIP